VHKSGAILKINIRKSCLGIRSFRRSLASASIHRSLATTKANNWRRSAYDRCGRTGPFRPPMSTAYRPCPRGQSLLALLSACGGHLGTSHACHSSLSDTWGPIVAVGSIPALLPIFNWSIASSCQECHIFISLKVTVMVF